VAAKKLDQFVEDFDLVGPFQPAHTLPSVTFFLSQIAGGPDRAILIGLRAN
jgi:hypothetical protein